MTSRLHGLDALRGIAALLVFASHVAGYFELPWSLPAQARSVDLFFVLSGYVLARTYEGRMPPASQFLRLRYRRLVPVAAVGTAIGAAVVLANGASIGATLATLGVMLLFLPALWEGNLFKLNTPVWSLFIEIVANFAHAALFARIPTCVLAVLAVYGVIGYAPLLGIEPDMGAPYAVTLLPAIGRGLSAYLVGIIIWRLRGDSPLNGIPPLAGVIAFPLLALACQALGFAGAVVFTFFAAPLIIMSTIGLRDSRFFAYLGALSFPLYATHYPVLQLADMLGAGPWLASFFALAFAGMLVAALEVRSSSVLQSGRHSAGLSPTDD